MPTVEVTTIRAMTNITCGRYGRNSGITRLAVSRPTWAGGSALLGASRNMTGSAQDPQLPADHRAVGHLDEHERTEPGRLQPLQLRPELPAPPHRLHHASDPGNRAQLPRHLERV